jgi:hypothetical protein
VVVTNWATGREYATMGSMSASAAAPLPRLGEVFFDVRGGSRSMRLSWYAGTGTSVFSIWQGGTCTGTFRLSQEDLPRLIDALQRGMYGGEPRDQRGTGGYLRQLPGDPTDPRLTPLSGYGGTRDLGGGDFTGPVTGDFRALRPDDQGGARAHGSASPRALPPPAASTSGPLAYRDERQYPEQAQYRGQEYAEQGHYGALDPLGPYPEQGQYQAAHAGAPQYVDQPYAEHGHHERGYGPLGPLGPLRPLGPQPGQGYDDPGYPPTGDQGHRGYGHDEQGYAGPDAADRGYAGPSYHGSSSPGPGYPGPEYPGQGYEGQSYQGQGYDGGSYPSQGYDDRGYQQQGYRGQAYSEQDYAGYGRAEQPTHGQAYDAPESYPGSEASGAYATQDQPYGYGQPGYQEEVGRSYPDQGYNEYGYADQDYQGQGYADQGEAGQAYQEQGYTYAGDQGSSGYPAGYDSPGYDSPGYDRTGYDSRGQDSGAYDTRGQDSGGYDTRGQDSGGYDSGGYDGGGYDGGGYQNGSGQSGGYYVPSSGSGPRGGPQYQDPDVTPSQPLSSFPYDGGPSAAREHRRRRRR